jgi:hypothetical protein
MHPAEYARYFSNWPAHKATRRVAAGQNVGGVERGRRSRPSETEPRAAYWRRSIYSPVIRSTPFMSIQFLMMH